MHKVIVKRASGVRQGTVQQVLQDFDSTLPELSWYEPQPGCGLDSHGKPISALQAAELYPFLTKGRPVFADKLIVDEAMQWYANGYGCLHLLRQGKNCRWAAWYIDNHCSSFLATETFDTEDGCALQEARSVWPISDRARFSLNNKHPEKTMPLRQRLVMQNGVCIGWSLFYESAIEECSHG